MKNFLNRLRSEWKNEWLVAACMLLVILLRIPSLFEPYWYGDEGVYLTLGNAIRNGSLLYRDIYDNKPPVLYMLAGLTGNVAWFRALLLVWMLATIIFFWLLLKKLFPEKETLIKVSLVFFTLLSSIPLIEGNIANAEIFMIGPTILAFYLMAGLLIPKTQVKTEPIKAAAAGILLGIAFLLKVPAVFDCIALFAFGVILLSRENWKKLLMTYSALGAGFLIPVVASFGFFAWHLAAGEYLRSAFLQNFGYVSSWRAGSSSGGGLKEKAGLLGRAGAVALFFGGLYYARNKFKKADILVFLWFAFALFGALLSERPYPHYLIQALPALAIVVGMLASRGKLLVKSTGVALVLVLAVSVFLIHFWAYAVGAYYRNFVTYAVGAETKTDYLRYFGNQVVPTYNAAGYLAVRLNTNDRIFVWGDYPYLYPLSKTLPVGRYTATYHIVDYNGYDETITALEKANPRYIVVDANEKRPFAKFFDYLKSFYYPESYFDNIIVYHRNIE
jgi:hypothetical protein